MEEDVKNYREITVYVELLVSQIFGESLISVMQLASILIGGFEYCMERNPCLQPKWCTFNLVMIYMIRQIAKLNPPPNSYTTAMVCFKGRTVEEIVSSFFEILNRLYKIVKSRGDPTIHT